MIYMYGGPIGRDKITREVKYVKRTIYVKGYDSMYLSIAYLKEPFLLACANPGSQMEEVATGRLDYRLVDKKGNIFKYEMCSTHPLEEK